MSNLVQKLSNARNRVVLDRYKDAKTLKDRIESGLVLIKFIDTTGGTELGVRLEPNESTLSAADFEGAAGTIRLVGTLTLDFVKVRCHAEIDVGSLTGEGCLVPIDEHREADEQVQ